MLLLETFVKSLFFQQTLKLMNLCPIMISYESLFFHDIFSIHSGKAVKVISWTRKWLKVLSHTGHFFSEQLKFIFRLWKFRGYLNSSALK